MRVPRRSVAALSRGCAAVPRRALRRCGAAAAAGGDEVQGAYGFSAQLRQAWRGKRGHANPLYSQLMWWQGVPKPPGGSLVLDVAGMFTAEEFAEADALLRELRDKHGITVYLVAFGDGGPRNADMTGAKLLRHWFPPQEYPAQAVGVITVCRMQAQADIRVGPGLLLAFGPLWRRSALRKCFQVRFRNVDWSVKVLEFVRVAHSRGLERAAWVQTGEKGPFILVHLADYWFVWAFALLGAFMGATAFADYRRYWWKERWCPSCAAYMEPEDDPSLLHAHLTEGQRREVELRCVEYQLWLCPNAEKGCASHFVEETKWCSLRLDCLRCQKCHHRTSHGRRVIGAAPDVDNFGEAVNIRTCKFCGFEEAWASVMQANYNGWNDPEHERPLVSDYGSSWWLMLRMSYVGKFLFPGENSGIAQLTKDGAGHVPTRDGGYERGKWFWQQWATKI
eukprot:TRINITY_DN12105_c0_g1_i1.p1 TRINITY_DN12105_c0_g1~~TRINITY_DN12105_c0_g1_i1.p1  ORF type:complete len:450 (+),score=131.30 TRINITY_DN12105_c0_g1_i1:73-1422(+)